MRGKRFATAVGCLTLALVVCLALMWPSLRDVWYVRQLRAEDSFLETALLDPMKCPSSAIERYLETKRGKISLIELYVREADRRFAGGSVVYNKGFHQALVLVHVDTVFTRVFSESQGGSSTFGSTKGQDLLQAINDHLMRLEGFSYDSQSGELPSRRFAVMRAGDAARKVGYYLRFGNDGSLLNTVSRTSWREDRGEGQLPENVTQRDIEILNQGFALVVERK